jgi:protoheme IX farnesyltransferase
MLAYTLALLPVGVLPTLTGVVGWGYGAFAMLAGLAFVGHAVRVRRAADDDMVPARAMFRYSLAYLFLLFAAMVADRLVLG